MDDPANIDSHAVPALASALTLRRATSGESELVYRIRKLSVIAQEADGDASWDEVAERARHARRFATQEYRLLLVRGQPVGIMALEVEAAAIRLNQFFVLPMWQQRGMGQAAMALLLQEAGQGMRAVRLEVVAGNDRALAFYAGFGFVQVGNTAQRIQMERAATS